MPMRCYLGIDNGGTKTKAALFDVSGRMLAVESMDTAVRYPAPGFVERDMEQMWQANCTVIRRVLAQASCEPSQVAALAVCGHGKGLYLCDRAGAPLLGILSTDSRAAKLQARWQRDGTERALFPRTLQHCLACQPTALLCWLKENRPSLYSSIGFVFSCKDYLRFRLTGTAMAELTDCSGSGLLNLTTRSYDPVILQTLGLSALTAALPPLCASGAVCGCISAQAARQTGLAEGTPVAGGMFDIDACALASGVTSPELLCIIAGTWGINECLSAQPVTDGSIRMNSLYCLPEYYLLEESSPTSVGTMEWVLRTLFPDALSRCGEAVYELLAQQAGSVAPQEPCPLFFPYLVGGATNAAARGAFFGLEASHTAAHILRAVFEGIAFTHKAHVDRLRGSGRIWERIRLAGGAARSPFWAQLFADVMNLPVEAVGVRESGALGCAMCAAVAAGEYAGLRQASAAMTPRPACYLPGQKCSEIYQNKYQKYLRFLPFAETNWET